VISGQCFQVRKCGDAFATMYLADLSAVDAIFHRQALFPRSRSSLCFAQLPLDRLGSTSTQCHGSHFAAQQSSWCGCACKPTELRRHWQLSNEWGTPNPAHRGSLLPHAFVALWLNSRCVRGHTDSV
jgi:hypothetical protein